MTLNVEKIGSNTKPNLTFIHGWGAQNAVWRDWAKAQFSNDYFLHLIELPGFGHSDKIENLESKQAIAEAWTQALIDALPSNTHLLGWSLGGLLAQQIAIQAPQKINKLICLASTPRFTQTDHWQWAVSPKLMTDFMRSLNADSMATLKSFWALQMQGSDMPRKNLKQFIQRMQSYQIPSATGLVQGLKLLKYFDFRNDADQIKQPMIWLLGELDPLIPQEFISEFSTIQPQARVQILKGAAHTPFSSHPEQTALAIREFLTTTN